MDAGSSVISNTRVTYLYRDASNYAETHSVVVTGEPDVLQRAFAAASPDGLFIPSQVGLPDLQERIGGGRLYEDDGPWHEILGVEPAAVAATVDLSADELAQHLKSVTWDEAAWVDAERVAALAAADGDVTKARLVGALAAAADTRKIAAAAATHLIVLGGAPETTRQWAADRRAAIAEYLLAHATDLADEFDGTAVIDALFEDLAQYGRSKMGLHTTGLRTLRAVTEGVVGS